MSATGWRFQRLIPSLSQSCITDGFAECVVRTDPLALDAAQCLTHRSLLAEGGS